MCWVMSTNAHAASLFLHFIMFSIMCLSLMLCCMHLAGSIRIGIKVLPRWHEVAESMQQLPGKPAVIVIMLTMRQQQTHVSVLLG